MFINEFNIHPVGQTIINVIIFFLLLQLKGSIDETNSTVEIVDKLNNYQIYPRIISIVSKDYFKFFKVRICYFLFVVLTYYMYIFTRLGKSTKNLSILVRRQQMCYEILSSGILSIGNKLINNNDLNYSCSCSYILQAYLFILDFMVLFVGRFTHRSER